jgi:elongation factor G
MRGDGEVIKAETPLAHMFGYATRLRSLSQGRAFFNLEFQRYERVPAATQQDILKKLRGY